MYASVKTKEHYYDLAKYAITLLQMGDKFNVTMNDLVKNLRLALLESPEVQQ